MSDQRTWPDNLQETESTVVEAFEDYEASTDTSFGTDPEDFMPWYECFRAGFDAGGCS